MFVPAGWFHVVRNLDMTVCVTQNYVPKISLEIVEPLKEKFPLLSQELKKQYLEILDGND